MFLKVEEKHIKVEEKHIKVEKKHIKVDKINNSTLNNFYTFA